VNVAREGGAARVVEGALLWEPSPEIRASANISRYIGWLRENHGLTFSSYDALWQWSVTDIDAFWQSIWEYFDVQGHRGTGPVGSGRMPATRWFPTATGNYARQALRWQGERPAVVFRSEKGDCRTLAYPELTQQVARTAAGLRALGVSRGDRVVGYLPNIPEALIAFLAAASIGAIWSSCSPDFGAAGVIDRFQQIEPKVLIAADGYSYAGKAHDRGDAIRRIEAALPTVRTTVLVPYLSAEAVPDGLRHGMRWADLLQDADELQFAELPFDHPLWVLYSSGTTGLPKAIVHGHGGVLLEHLKALSFHMDLGPKDVFFWFTTTGWMMWNYLVGGVLVGATVVLYDGSPGYPDMMALWRMAAQTGVTYFGTSASYLTACMKAGIQPGIQADLSRIRGIGSTGSPLAPEDFQWVYDMIGRNLLLGSFSGGTDVCTGFVGPCPLLPVRAGEIQCRCLGAKVEAYDLSGQPVIDEVGELVITEPMPSMPINFWSDPEGTRYRESYFATYPGVWRHGDWIKVTPRGSCVIDGRSDSTLNRGGVRMGTSEFYRVVEKFPEILDSLVVDTGQLGREGKLYLFLVLAEGRELDEALIDRLKATLRAELSPRHVPDEIHPLPGIPRTLSGKKLEVPIKRILTGTPLDVAVNPDTLSNPDVLPYFISFATR